MPLLIQAEVSYLNKNDYNETEEELGLKRINKPENQRSHANICKLENILTINLFKLMQQINGDFSKFSSLSFFEKCLMEKSEINLFSV